MYSPPIFTWHKSYHNLMFNLNFSTFNVNTWAFEAPSSKSGMGICIYNSSSTCYFVTVLIAYWVCTKLACRHLKSVVLITSVKIIIPFLHDK